MTSAANQAVGVGCEFRYPTLLARREGAPRFSDQASAAKPLLRPVPLPEQ